MPQNTLRLTVAKTASNTVAKSFGIGVEPHIRHANLTAVRASPPQGQ